MSVRCIALDLDGTTLNDDKSITDRTKRAIESAISAGIHVVVASGRCLDSLPESITGIDGVEFAITSNGAAVYDLRNRKCLRRVTLSLEAVDKLLSVTEGRKVTYEVFYEGVPYANRAYVEDPLGHGATPYAVNYIRSTRQPVEDIRDFIQAHKNQIDGIDLITRDQKLREELWESLQSGIPDIYITSSVPNRIETASIHAGKHQGLAHILHMLHLSPQEAAAFGDADNDVEMLSYVKYGMAVANATERCKAAAREIVPNNREDGVAVGIEKLISMDD